MHITITIDDDLLAKGQHITGMCEPAALVHEGLRALIERESARRLAKLGGSQSELSEIPRRESDANP